MPQRQSAPGAIPVSIVIRVERFATCSDPPIEGDSYRNRSRTSCIRFGCILMTTTMLGPCFRCAGFSKSFVGNTSMRQNTACKERLIALLIALLLSSRAPALNLNYADRGWYSPAGSHNPNNVSYIAGDTRGAGCIT